MKKIDHPTLPVLFLRTSDACYHVLNLFIDELAKALYSCGQPVEIIDMTKGTPSLELFLNRRFRAVIGIQTNLINSFSGKKYLILLDHPITMHGIFECSDGNHYILTHDRNYLSFIQRYYRNVTGCFYFPPAGTLPSSCGTSITHPPQKQYGITFFGTYHNYREPLSAICSYPRPYRITAARLIHVMRRNPNISAEKALSVVFRQYNLELSDPDFLEMFAAMKPVFDCVMFYYREKIIHTILQAGIEIHVYSDSWNNAPFSKHPCLVQHPALNPPEALLVTQRSKLSLNIMSWHKDGLTERVLNAMLCQTAVLSDRSTRLEEEFTDGKDILLFDLSNLDSLPEKIQELLSDNDRLQQIAQNGYQKAMQNHLWIHRAKHLLTIL